MRIDVLVKRRSQTEARVHASVAGGRSWTAQPLPSGSLKKTKEFHAAGLVPVLEQREIDGLPGRQLTGASFAKSSSRRSIESLTPVSMSDCIIPSRSSTD